MIGVLSVDDHALPREGIAALVNAESDMKLIAVASKGQEAIEKFRLHGPDGTLMDLQMAALNGIEAITTLADLSASNAVLQPHHFHLDAKSPPVEVPWL